MLHQVTKKKMSVIATKQGTLRNTKKKKKTKTNYQIPTKKED